MASGRENRILFVKRRADELHSHRSFQVSTKRSNVLGEEMGGIRCESDKTKLWLDHVIHMYAFYDEWTKIYTNAC